MIDTELMEAGTNWRDQINHYQELLEKVKPQLIDAETELTEQMAAINAFEFRLRTRISPLASKLDVIEAEIKEYRTKLRWRSDEIGDGENGRSGWTMRDVEDVVGGAGAAASGDYRYMDAATQPSPEQTADPATLKQLYRQLARRFHPDLALDAADRVYRTSLMIAINTAYATGDLAKLQALALEPDHTDHPDYAQTDQQLAEALQQELARCHRRLEEIKRELEKLENHPSSRLMRRAEQAEAEGRDWLAEVVQQILNKIARKTAERDMLRDEIAYAENEAAGFEGDDFADAVFDLSLEDVYDEDPSSEATEWLRSRYQHDRWGERSQWDEEDENYDDL
jgi:predicted  nucleic acid-binding Zn-ribbon protein